MNNLDHRTSAPRLASVTCARPLSGENTLAELLRTGDECAWIRFGNGMVGLGTAARFHTHGPDRFDAARQWWEQAVNGAAGAQLPGAPALTGTIPVIPPHTHHHDDGPVPSAATAPIAFAAFAFDDASPVPSVVRVPELVVSAVDGHAWLTWQVDLDAPEHRERAAEGWRPDAEGAERRLAELLGSAEAGAGAGTGADATLTQGVLDREGYLSAVAAGVEAIRAGRLTKLVVARDAVMTTAEPVDVPRVLRELTTRYADCWTYSVDGLIGATPEMLIKVERGQARSRVLAGTLDRSGAPRGSDGTAFATRMLFEDEKQRHEHQLAIDSLTERLGPLTQSLDAHQEPFVLELPNVWHLASDVTAQLARSGTEGRRATALDLAQVLHPTAAVCGTPRDEAAALIRQLEHTERGMDRGLYAGPVGWMDAAGNGEFGIALRGAVVEDQHTVRLYAGCGVVAASDPEAELAETSAKMRPMLQALGLRD